MGLGALTAEACPHERPARVCLWVAWLVEAPRLPWCCHPCRSRRLLTKTSRKPLLPLKRFFCSLVRT